MSSNRKLTTTPTLKGSQKPTLATQLKIQEVAELITNKGYGRLACLKYCKEKWNVSETQADRYYSAALIYLRPDNPEEYREALIARNFGILEGMLQKALENNDLGNATQIVKVMNTMLNVGDKKIALETENTKIVVSFGE